MKLQALNSLEIADVNGGIALTYLAASISIIAAIEPTYQAIDDFIQGYNDHRMES